MTLKDIFSGFPDEIEKAKKELADLEDQFKKLTSVGIDFGREFTDSVKNVEKLTAEFEKGKDISKQVNRELRQTRSSLNLSYNTEKLLTAESQKLLASTNANEVAQGRNLQIQIQQLKEERKLLLGLEEQYETLQKISSEKKQQNTVTGYLLSKAKAFNTTYLSTLGILKFIIGAAFDADKQTTELAKSLGISKDQASTLRDRTVEYARASGDAFVTTKKLMEAQGDLTQQLGVAVNYTDKQREDFSRLTKLMGLSVEQAGKLARLSIVNKTSIEDTAKAIIRGSAASQRSNRISVDQREILKDVANLSEGILIKFKGNPEALGAAVVQARKLGITLEQVDKIGESLLNWESSIQSELEAELITGRQLNFEKARYAALTGDQTTLMQELSNQVGSLSQYQNMNVIAQGSLAKAFGMSRDEMSKMLLEQEKINKLGDVSQMTLDKQLETLRAQGEPLDSALYKSIQQQSAQEKFNNAVEKLQDILGNLLAGPVGRLLDAFANLASNATALYGVMGLLAGISLVKTIGSLITMATTLAASSIEALTLSSVLSAGLIIPVALAAAAAGYAWMKSKSDEAQSNIPGYAIGSEKITNSGLAMVHEGETIIPAKSAGRFREERMSGGSNEEYIRHQRRTNELLEQIFSRPSIAIIPTRTLQDAGASPYLGTAQSQNTYPFA